MSDPLAQYLPQIVAAAQKYGTSAADLWGVLHVEDPQGNPNAVSPDGAIGLGQFLPSTAAAAGYGIAPFNPADPNAAINAAAQYLAALQSQYGEDMGIIAYNAGPGNVAKYGAAASMLPDADPTYLNDVLSYAKTFPGPLGTLGTGNASASQSASAAPTATPVAQVAPIVISDSMLTALIVVLALFLVLIALGAF